MAFKGITFAGQNVTPKNDGGLYQAHCGDGILWGCSMALSGDDLVIQSGEFIACGRVCQVDGATNVDLSTRTLTNGYIQVVMDFDTSKPEGEQWNIHLPLIESATTTFPALTKDDINDTGTLYQLELAIVQISGGNLTSIYTSFVNSGVISHYENDPNFAHIKQVSDGGFRLGLASPVEGGNFASLSGLSGSLTNLVLFGNGSDVEFRPNGIGSTVGRAYLDTRGQFHGGATFTTATKSSSTSIPTASWTTVVSQNGLDASGIYVIVGYCSYTPSSNATQQIQYKLYGNSHGSYHTRIMPLQNNSIIALGTSDIITGDTTVSLQLYTNSNVYSGTASSGATLRILRIA